jgi:DNA-binding response OmpR family regulator
MLISRAASGRSGVPHVFVVEHNATLGRAILELLSAEGYTVETSESLEDLVARAQTSPCDLALIAWQKLQGLLADGRRHDLVQHATLIPMVVMLPRSWLRVLHPPDLPVRGLLAKPFDAEELLDCVSRSLRNAWPPSGGVAPIEPPPRYAPE